MVSGWAGSVEVSASNRAAGGHGVSRAEEQIQQDLFERRRIAQHPRETRVESCEHVDPLPAQLLPGEQEGIVHDLAQIERLSVSLALPPEGQEPLGDVAQPLRATVQDLEIRHRLGRERLLLGLHQHQFDARQDDADRVVELVPYGDMPQSGCQETSVPQVLCNSVNRQRSQISPGSHRAPNSVAREAPPSQLWPRSLTLVSSIAGHPDHGLRAI